jgi:hypothetical protein
MSYDIVGTPNDGLDHFNDDDYEEDYDEAFPTDYGYEDDDYPLGSSVPEGKIMERKNVGKKEIVNLSPPTNIAPNKNVC